MAAKQTTGKFKTQCELVKALDKMRKTGATVKAICDECEIAVPTYYRLRPAGQTARKAVGNRGTRAQLEDRVHLMRANGNSDAVIARAVGVAPQTIKAIRSPELPAVEASPPAAEDLITSIMVNLTAIRRDVRALKSLL